MIEELARIVGPDDVLIGSPSPYDADATGATLGFKGSAEAVVRPGSTEETRAVVAWCYENNIPIVPRGGGTGFAGGAVPSAGSVVVSVERLTRVRSIDPGSWRMCVEAGVSTHTVARLAQESRLFFPPNPGASEQSLIGGNIATNAGGSHAFKYGVTRRWVTGVEAVVAPGDVLDVGGPVRKDVSGYDMVGLLTGSEGTLGIITAAWISLLPAPERRAVVVSAYADTDSGCAAISSLFATGVQPAAIEYIDQGALEAARASFPARLPEEAAFLVMVEIDGSTTEVASVLADVETVLAPDSLATIELISRRPIQEMLRWRDGVSSAVTGLRGAKLSEDIVVPVDRIGEALARAADIGAATGLPVGRWGHAGDGNLHVSYLLGADEDRAPALHASRLLHAEVIGLGGSISGEHGIGSVKRGELREQLGPVGFRLHGALKRALDPKGLFNPGKKD